MKSQHGSPPEGTLSLSSRSLQSCTAESLGTQGSGLGDVIKNRDDGNGGDEMVMMGMTEADTGDMRTPGGCSESR